MITTRGRERPPSPSGGSQAQPSRVAAVLLNFRAETEDDTRACIHSLRASTGVTLDIILVDNGSPAGVGERLATDFPYVTVIQTGENLGFTGGNNRGFERALERDCDYVLALNNDTVVEPECVARLVQAAHSEAHVGAVGGKILYYDAPDRIWFGGGWFSPVSGLGYHRGEGERDTAGTGEVEEVTFLTGCCMLFPAEVLRTVGGFAEDFFAYVEDVDVSVRLRAAGYRLLYQPAARLYHRVPVHEEAISPCKIVLRDRNRRRMMRRQFSPLARLRFACFFYPSRMVHAARYLVGGDWARLKSTWQGMILP